MKYLAIIIALIPFTINAQSVFVDQAGGMGAGIGIQSISEVKTLGTSFGYSIAGRTDVGIGINRTTINDFDNLAELGFTIAAQYFILKQGSKLPISLSVGGNYTFSTFTGSALGESDGSGKTYSFFTGLYHSIKASDSVSIIPNLSVSQTSQTVDLFGFESTDSGLTAGIGCSVAVDVGNNLVVITPGFLARDGGNGFRLDLTYVISK